MNRTPGPHFSRLIGLGRDDSLALQQDERFAVGWNETDREKYAVIRERYASDLSDAEFALIKPHLPVPKPRRREPADDRAILNALFYPIRCGCPWRYLPKDFPPFTTVQNRFYAWRDSGSGSGFSRSSSQRSARRKEKAQRPLWRLPIAGRSGRRMRADLGGTTQARRSMAARSLGSKWHSPIAAMPVMRPRAAFGASRIRLTVIKRTGRTIKAFVVLPKCWIAERTLGWLNRARSLARDFEVMLGSSCARVLLALAFLLLRRLTRDYRAAG